MLTERKEKICLELIRFSNDLGIRIRKVEESVSDLQPDSDISETRKSRFESQVKHILVLADSGVMTLLQWKKCQSFGLETPCTR